jgi:hypothetical protein
MSQRRVPTKNACKYYYLEEETHESPALPQDRQPSKLDISLKGYCIHPESLCPRGTPGPSVNCGGNSLKCNIPPEKKNLRPFG